RLHAEADTLEILRLFDRPHVVDRVTEASFGEAKTDDAPGGEGLEHALTNRPVEQLMSLSRVTVEEGEIVELEGALHGGDCRASQSAGVLNTETDVLEHLALIAELAVREEPDLELAGCQLLEGRCESARGDRIRIDFAVSRRPADLELFGGTGVSQPTAKQNGRQRPNRNVPQNHWRFFPFSFYF